MNRQPFSEASYLAQVRRLRNLAAAAVSKFPLHVKAINFIHHGENTTFRIDGKGGRKFLLRVHRNDYHTKAAIEEELAWLSLLSKAGVPVPKPITSKRGEWVETVSHPDVSSSRNCSMFEWIEGRFIRKSVKPKHLYQVGTVIADLQTHVPRSKVAHRRYWTSEGLVGAKAKFGSIDTLSGVRPKQQKVLREGRKFIFKELIRFERKFPERMGLIHADLHFGNILSIDENLGAIDFDDCGHGFHAYDLVIPLLSVEALLGEDARKRMPEFKNALLEGYTTKKRWDRDDERIFPHLITARRLLMLGWLNSRSDNPRLKKHMKGAVDRALKHLKSKYEIA